MSEENDYASGDWKKVTQNKSKRDNPPFDGNLLQYLSTVLQISSRL